MDGLFFIKEWISFRMLVPFVPIFVAIDVLGILPIFISLTSEMEPSGRKKVVQQSVLTAFLASLGFLVAGKSEGGTKGIAKVSSLFLAAIAVRMIRTGIMEWTNQR